MLSDEETPPTPSSDEESAPATPGSTEEDHSSASTDSEDVITQSPAIKPTLKPRTVPKSDWQFAFGPQNCYWVRIGAAWTFVRSKNSEDWSDIHIRDPYWAVFKHTTGFLVGGSDEDGEPKIYRAWNKDYSEFRVRGPEARLNSLVVRAADVDDFVESREAYKELHNWLDAKQLEDTSVSIGPKGSYFARCGSSWISHKLPKDLQRKLDRNKDEFTPIHVALGLNGSWIVIWSDGDLSWNFRNSYPDLAHGLALTDGVGQVTFAALNPYEENRFFVVGENGYAVNVSMDSLEKCNELQKMVDGYLQLKSKRDGTTFKFPVKIGDQTRNVYITPDTYKSVPADSLLETWKERRGVLMRSVLMRRDNIALIGAVTVGGGTCARLAGATPVRAIGAAAAAGVAGTVAMMFGINQGLRQAGV